MSVLVTWRSDWSVTGTVKFDSCESALFGPYSLHIRIAAIFWIKNFFCTKICTGRNYFLSSSFFPIKNGEPHFAAFSNFCSLNCLGPLRIAMRTIVRQCVFKLKTLQCKLYGGFERIRLLLWLFINNRVHYSFWFFHEPSRQFNKLPMWICAIKAIAELLGILQN